MDTRRGGIRDVRMVGCDDPGYAAHCRRAAAIRLGNTDRSGTGGIALAGADGVCRYKASPREFVASMDRAAQAMPPGGRTAAYFSASRSAVGRLAERAARRWLGTQVKLDPRRVVVWREPDGFGQTATRYQELDGACRVDAGTMAIYEVKLTSLGRMREMAGRDQLQRAARALRACPSVNRVVMRLVYVGDGVDRLIVGCGAQRADDMEAEFGVIWITPSELEWAAADIGTALPAAWRDMWGMETVTTSVPESHGGQPRSAQAAVAH